MTEEKRDYHNHTNDLAMFQSPKDLINLDVASNSGSAEAVAYSETQCICCRRMKQTVPQPQTHSSLLADKHIMLYLPDMAREWKISAPCIVFSGHGSLPFVM